MKEFIRATVQVLSEQKKLLKWLLGAVALLYFIQLRSLLAAGLPERITFQNILENKDITLGQGGAIRQDSDGFLWLGGTNALLRYDGYEFKQIDAWVTTEGSDKKMEPVKTVQDIFEDRNKNLWISTRTGVFRFDPIKESMIKIADDNTQNTKISTSIIMRIVELPSGELLACSLSGLFVIDPETYRYKVIVPDPNNKENGLHSISVNAGFIDKSAVLWLGTDSGLERVDWQKMQFTLHQFAPDRAELVADNRVTDIVAGDDGKFWVATTNGLVRFDPVTGEHQRYINNPDDPYSLGGNDIWRLLMDSQGVLWIASDGGGVSVYDQDRDRFINHKYEPGRVGSLNSNQVRTLYEDKSGDIWIGNYPVGINFFDRSSSAITLYSRDISDPKSLSHNSVLGISEDKDGNLWLGTDGGGLSFFNRESGIFENYLHDPKDPSSIPGNAINAVFIDSKGIVWLGFWGAGLASFNPVDKTFTRFPYDKQRKSLGRITTSDRLNSEHVWSIREDENHELWITTHTGGLSKYNRDTKVFTHYTHIEGDPQSLTSDSAWINYEDSQGRLWIGTSAGLNLMDKQSGTFTHYISDPNNPKSLSNPSAITLFEDSKNRLWVGTSAGLNLFNPETNDFTSYTVKNGFINDFIRTITEDSQGNLWISSNNGFSSFSPESGKIKSYNRIGGRLTLGFFKNSGLTSRHGEIIFGGITGLRIIDPAGLSDNHNIPKVAFTDLKVLSDSVLVDGRDGLLKASINRTDRLVLNHKNNMVEFGFAALNFRDTQKNQYAYQLLGFDQDWIATSGQRMAKYTNLNPGTYVFKVKGSNNDGIWNEDGKSVTVIQLPPPWKTWWAYALYGLAFVSALAWFIYLQRRKRHLVEEQNRILEVKVSERTAEVRAKSNDIQAMLSNIPQGLFTVYGDSVIHPEYSLHLEFIFDTNDIAGRHVIDFLFNRSKLGSDALESTKAAIFAILGEDEMNFSFNRQLLISEYEIEVAGTKKYLSLDWNPIVEVDIVTKLMVSVRDVTQIKRMESSAREQKRKLDIVSQLLELSAEKYLAFEESSVKYLLACRDAVESCTERDEKVVALLFRNMHTIKGNCRTYGFTHLSNTAHEIESTYTVLKASKDSAWDTLSLMQELDVMEDALAEYAHVYRTVLGRGAESSSGHHDGFWMNNTIMEKIREYVDANEIEALKVYLSRINANTLEQDLVDIVTSLSTIASQLDKKMPVVTIEPSNVRILVTAQELVKDVFAHILRNCVDHGLESTEERLLAEKNIHGAILIRPSVIDGELHISVEDDGRGANIARLFRRGVEFGRWNADDSPSLADIVNLMFCSGVTTKDTVTDISGRGVGLDAVNQFLAERGGRAFVKLHQEKVVHPDFMPFELIVTLPSNAFFEVDENRDS
jgi:ligand-binding sensor domain-containing protein/HPt (histidine-containing phosphotransfer) domain-containing protein